MEIASTFGSEEELPPSPAPDPQYYTLVQAGVKLTPSPLVRPGFSGSHDHIARAERPTRAAGDRKVVAEAASVPAGHDPRKSTVIWRTPWLTQLPLARPANLDHALAGLQTSPAPSTFMHSQCQQPPAAQSLDLSCQTLSSQPSHGNTPPSKGGVARSSKIR